MGPPNSLTPQGEQNWQSPLGNDNWNFRLTRDEADLNADLNVLLGFALGNIEVSWKENSVFPTGPAIKCFNNLHHTP